MLKAVDVPYRKSIHMHHHVDGQFAELDEILRGGRRMKAVASTVMMVNKARNTHFGQKGSQACTLQ